MEKHMEYHFSQYCRRVRGEHENHIQKLKQKIQTLMDKRTDLQQTPSTNAWRI
jgi:hypothetical protein